MAESVTVATRNEEETRALGAALGEAAEAGDVILLQGPFGAGKTTLVQGLARGLGVDDQVTSPSFVIACEYQGRVPLYHIDLYRIEQMDETTLEALAEYFGTDGVCAVEWPDAVPTDLVRGAVRIGLEAPAEDERSLTLNDAPARLREVFERRVAQPTKARARRPRPKEASDREAAAPRAAAPKAVAPEEGSNARRRSTPRH
jgi:tRNA threonylcarbamoyladenosine biosynthesis protein TsaE